MCPGDMTEKEIMMDLEAIFDPDRPSRSSDVMQTDIPNGWHLIWDEEETKAVVLIDRLAAVVEAGPFGPWPQSSARLSVLRIYAEVVHDLRENRDPLLFEAGASVGGLARRWGLPLDEGRQDEDEERDSSTTANLDSPLAL